jgi:hypothetical protein
MGWVRDVRRDGGEHRQSAPRHVNGCISNRSTTLLRRAGPAETVSDDASPNRETAPMVPTCGGRGVSRPVGLDLFHRKVTDGYDVWTRWVETLCPSSSSSRYISNRNMVRWCLMVS